MPIPAYLATTHYADEYQHIEKIIRCYRSRQNVLRAQARLDAAHVALSAAEDIYTWDCELVDEHSMRPVAPTPTISERIDQRVRRILSLGRAS